MYGELALSCDLLDKPLDSLVETLITLLKQKHIMLSTAESCTGGLISALMTQRAGSSKVFDRGFISYSNEAKIDLLKVPQDILTKHGAISAQCAETMASSALKNSRASIAVSVTGIAGPAGGSTEKPVGLVYIGIAKDSETLISHKHTFSGNRTSIRTQTCKKAFEHIIEALQQS